MSDANQAFIRAARPRPVGVTPASLPAPPPQPPDVDPDGLPVIILGHPDLGRCYEDEEEHWQL